MRLVKTKENKRLIELSYEMMLNAYAPYSNFSVGAAILSENDKLFGGCNVDDCRWVQNN